MADYDASQAGSNPADTGPIARPDVDSLPAGSMGPASGNTITGSGTVTGQTGADTPGAGGASVVEVHGAGGATSGGAGNFQASGQYGVLSMDAQGNYNYVRNPGTPDGVRDVFQYTLADAQGANAASTLTIDIGQVLTANAGIVNLPSGVELSDIHVVGRDLVIDMPDGTHMVIPNGAVFVPQLSIGDVAVPASNVAALLIDSEPQPAAGNTPSSGGNFADPVPPLDPGVPLGDLIPPTELSYNPPEFKPEGQFIDREPTIVIQPDGQPASVAAIDDVNEKGLPTRNGGEPAGSGEIADGDASNNSDGSETTGGTIIIDSPDGVGSVMINGVLVTGAAGQQIAGEFGTLTITGFSGSNILYSYTLNDNTSGDNTHDDFSVTVTDDDGDQATATLTVDIIDDTPTARNDTDSADTQTHVATGNVITGADTTSGSAGHDTVGADNANVTAVSSNNVPGHSDSDASGGFVVDGQYGSLTMNPDGSYTYTLHSDAPGGSTDVFTYTLTDGDGDPSTATLTINNPDHQPTLDVPTAGEAGTVVDEKGLPPHEGLPAGSGEIADGNADNDSDKSEGTNGTIHFTQGDAPATVTIDGVVVTGTVGQQFVGDHGTLTITGYNAASGTITYSYLLTESTSGDNTSDSFAVVVTDSDGDHANGTLNIDIIDDVPTARADTDLTDNQTHLATGNVISGADTTSGSAGADTQGADGAHVSAVTGFGGSSDSSLDGANNLQVDGHYGSLVLNSDGTYTYTLNEDAPGGSVDVFTYTLTDGDGDSRTATLTITNPDNHPTLDVPTQGEAGTIVDEKGLPPHDGLPAGSGEIADSNPNNDSDQSEQTSGTINFTPGDTPAVVTIDGVAVTGTIGQPFVGDHGTLVITGYDANAGTITYTYTLTDSTTDGVNDTDSFAVKVTDVDGDHADGTLTINIIDDVPTAHADINSVSEGGSVDGNVLPNDVPGADGYTAGGGVVGVKAGSDTSTAVQTGVNTVIHGTYGDLTLQADGSYTYTAKPDFISADATDTFVYTIKDGDGDLSTTTLTINVDNVDLNADNQVKTVYEEALDLTKDGHDLAASSVTGSNPSSDAETVQGQLNVIGATEYTAQTIVGTHGTIQINADGSYTYTLTSPVDETANDNGPDTVNNVESFDYTAQDADGNTVHGTIKINVVDDVPTAFANTNSVSEGSSVNGNVLTDGTDDVFGADGKVTPTGGVTGVVHGTNTASPVTGGVGVDVPGTYGTLHLNADGSYTYTANPDAITSNQVDHFVYTITDGDGDTSTTTLDINVNNVTVASTNDAALVNEAGLPVIGSDAASNSEIDSNGAIHPSGGTGPYTFTLTSPAVGSHGTLTLNADGTYTYTLTSPVDGTTLNNGTNTVPNVDNFNYTVTDAHGNTTTGTIHVDVIDDVPTARSDADSVTEDGPLVADGNVITGSGGSDVNITDGVADTKGADGATVTGIKLPADGSYGAVSTAAGGTQIVGAHGTLTIHADGTYSYQLNNADTDVQKLGAGQSTSDTFNYQLTDGDGDLSNANIVITINGANDAPTIGDGTTHVSDEGFTYSNPDTLGYPDNSADTTSSKTASGNISVGDIDNGASLTVTLTNPPAGLTADGQALSWSGSGTNTLTATAVLGGVTTPIMTITIDNTGHYTVTLQHAIDQPFAGVQGVDAGGGEDTINFNVTVNVSDGSLTDTGTLTVYVEDDSPVISSVTTPLVVPNSGTVSATGNFAFNVGGDINTDHDDISVSGFTVTVNGTAATNVVLTPGTETDSAANYSFSFSYPTGLGGTVTDTGTLVFDKATGHYTVDLANPISGFTISDTAGAPASAFVNYQPGTDNTSNPATEVAVVQLQPDLFIQFSGIAEPSSGTGANNLKTIDYSSTTGQQSGTADTGADAGAWTAGELFNQSSATVTISSSAAGVAGNTIQGGEVLDFNLYNSSPTGHLNTTPTASATSMFISLDGIGSSEDMIIVLKLYDTSTHTYTTKALMVENGDIIKAGVNDGQLTGTAYEAVAPTGNDGLIVIEANDYQAGNTNLVIVGAQIAGSDEGITGTATNFNGNIGASGNSSGTQDFSTDVSDAPFKIQNIGFLTQSTSDQGAQIQFDTTVTDADGDSATQHLTVNVGTQVSNNAAVNTLMATNSLASTSNLSSDHLVSTNDNHRSFEEHRSSNSAALLGAIAAAGLSSAHEVAAEGFHGSSHAVHSGPIMAPQMMPTTQFAARDSGGHEASVQATHIVAEAQLMSTSHLSSPSDGAKAHSFAGHDNGGHQAVTQLLHGTEGPAMHHGPASVTAASIAIPSAQMLAAHMGVGKGGAEAQNVTDVQSNAVVGKVLADSLAGGHGHGPNIDALLHNAGAHGHGNAQDALAALASHDAGGVSNGHSGVFAGFHGVPLVEHIMAIHQDAPVQH